MNDAPFCEEEWRVGEKICSFLSPAQNSELFILHCSFADAALRRVSFTEDQLRPVSSNFLRGFPVI